MSDLQPTSRHTLPTRLIHVSLALLAHWTRHLDLSEMWRLVK
ncbi:hypothetical protein [Pseudosulfitobacter pseudonitzschiae]|nr:hypothetical protein [Pseudosulfitobacter pseudonitzschiae]